MILHQRFQSVSREFVEKYLFTETVDEQKALHSLLRVQVSPHSANVSKGTSIFRQPLSRVKLKFEGVGGG